MNGFIHSTDSFGTVDGPGIRFLVFTQGCPLRCQYCHNPDTWLVGAGRQMTPEEILSQYQGLKHFTKGGITVTGGEPLLQMPFVTRLFQLCHQQGIHTALDTSGITFSANRIGEFDALMAVTDLVMLDIKHIDDEAHIALTTLSNRPVLEFAQYLSDIGKDVWIRHVVIPGLTLMPQPLYDLGYFLGGLRTVRGLDILPYHKMGDVKYQQLHLPKPLEGVPEASRQDALDARNRVLEGIKARLRANQLGSAPPS